MLRHLPGIELKASWAHSVSSRGKVPLAVGVWSTLHLKSMGRNLRWPRVMCWQHWEMLLGERCSLPGPSAALSLSCFRHLWPHLLQFNVCCGCLQQHSLWQWASLPARCVLGVPSLPICCFFFLISQARSWLCKGTLSVPQKHKNHFPYGSFGICWSPLRTHCCSRAFGFAYSFIG